MKALTQQTLGIAAIAALILLFSIPPSAHAALITNTTVTVNGTSYDVTFHSPQLTLSQIFDGNNDNILGDGIAGHAPTFTTETDARAAADAVRAALGTAHWTAVGPSITDNFFIVYGFDPTALYPYAGIPGDNIPALDDDAAAPIALWNFTGNVTGEQLGAPFATFVRTTTNQDPTTQVPLPTPLSLIAAGLFGVGVARRRRSTY